MSAAQRVVAAVGPDKATLRDVAREAGVSHGLITHYFGRFDALVDEVLDETSRQARQRIVERLQNLGDQSLEGALDAFFETMSEPLHGRLIAWSLLAGRRRADDFFTGSAHGPRRVADVIEARLRQQHPEGVVRREEIDRLLALVLVSGVGMSFGREAVWDALGREDAEREHQRFRSWLAALVHTRVREIMGIEGGGA